MQNVAGKELRRLAGMLLYARAHSGPILFVAAIKKDLPAMSPKVIFGRQTICSAVGNDA
jgi:hypothetical protein